MITRRNVLKMSAAAAVLSSAGIVRAAEDMKLNLTAYDKITPAKFPWGWIRWLMNADIDPKAELTVGIVLVEANQANQLHIHPNSQEVLHVLYGACDHRVGDQQHKIAAGDTLLIPKGIPHQARTADSPCLAMISYNTGKRVMVPVADEKPR